MGEVGSCQGSNFGGPSIQKSNVGTKSIRAVQVGVVSRGVGCAAGSRPAIYTKVAPMKDWILNNIAPGGCTTYI
jgi:secreted trypsin-like serine protease